ncbi:MAG: hypothetical protein VYC39_03465 [Myxococcota bacterium]|nr:hypothetical protein [Myxococcota bacterium]
MFYVFVGLRCAYQFFANYKSIWDGEFTPRDLEITSRAAFYLLIPPAVAAHELGHAVAVWGYGLTVVDWQFLGYMGWVAPSGSAGPFGDFVIALSGNVVSYLIGLAALLFPLRFPGHPARNVLLFELGRQSMFLVLVFYPVICIVFNGDFRRIYDFSATPVASGVVAFLHAAILIWGYRVWWKKRHQSRAMLLCSPVATDFIRLEKIVQTEPKNYAAHQQLGSLFLAVGYLPRARHHFEVVVDAGVADASCKLQFATLLAEERQTARAIPLLEEIRDKLLRPEQRYLAHLLLVRMNLLGGRAEIALNQAEAMRRARPDDLEGLTLWCQAMTHNGRKDEALKTVESLMDKASADEAGALRAIFEDLR